VGPKCSTAGRRGGGSDEGPKRKKNARVKKRPFRGGQKIDWGPEEPGAETIKIGCPGGKHDHEKKGAHGGGPKHRRGGSLTLSTCTGPPQRARRSGQLGIMKKKVTRGGGDALGGMEKKGGKNRGKKEEKKKNCYQGQKGRQNLKNTGVGGGKDGKVISQGKRDGGKIHKGKGF